MWVIYNNLRQVVQPLLSCLGCGNFFIVLWKVVGASKDQNHLNGHLPHRSLIKFASTQKWNLLFVK